MRRLYVHIYLTLLASLAALVLVFWLSRDLFEGTHEPPWLDLTSTILTRALPASDSSGELQAAVDDIGQRGAFPFSVYGADGRLLAASGEPIALPPDHSATHSVGPDRIAVLLRDGRWVVAGTRRAHAHAILLGMAALGLLIAAASYPFVRRLTLRLERLRSRVDALGSGDLQARVQIEGRDEIAELAQSFNRAAEHIERLVHSQRALLANASHELRSPLTRIGLAFELLAEPGRSDLREQVQRDIAELDELITELLLASRLQAVDHLERREAVDILALAASEAAHVGACVTGDPVEINGDPKLLRRLLRNLLENARRYGGGTQIAVTVLHHDAGACVRVEDRGSGIPEEERERVFEPFYRRAGTAETGHGVGLGLALVRQIARRHGGDARCLARAGGGTCFEVVLA